MRALGDDEDVARFTYVRAPLSDDAATAWVDRYVAGWLNGDLGGFAIETSKGGAFLGFIALVRYDDEGRETEIGYIVAPSARGRGVARRALELLTGWCLGPLGLERVELRIDVSNEASARLAERCGFVREGCFARRASRTGSGRISPCTRAFRATPDERRWAAPTADRWRRLLCARPNREGRSARGPTPPASAAATARHRERPSVRRTFHPATRAAARGLASCSSSWWCSLQRTPQSNKWRARAGVGTRER